MNITKISEEIFPTLTQEMINWYQKRTKYHISLVEKYCDKINSLMGSFNLNCSDHDQSKFHDPEYTPYIFITWQYKCKEKDGKEFPVSDYLKTLMAEATQHHVKSNDHHPEFFSTETVNLINRENRDKPPEKIVDATKMPLANIAEMVSDWCSVSEEKGTNPKDWADKNVNIRWKFNDEQKKLIYGLISKIWS